MVAVGPKVHKWDSRGSKYTVILVLESKVYAIYISMYIYIYIYMYLCFYMYVCIGPSLACLEKPWAATTGHGLDEREDFHAILSGSGSICFEF